MNPTIWKQTDSRWASKPYPVARKSTVGGTGCGLLACTHIAMEQERYKDWTPENLRPWMVKQGYATVGNGTKWEGITQTLEHLGHEKVVRIYSDPMSEAWKELNKGNRIGILLFNSHIAPNGTKWTASGHYVAFTDYKVQGGKHYFYTKDSGGRNHSGWYTYENSMKGCISKMWIVERVGKQVETPVIKATTYKPTKPYTSSLPKGVVKNGTKGTDAKAVQLFLNWCIDAKLSVDSNIGAKSETAIKVFQKTYGLTVDGIFGTGSKKKAQNMIDELKPKEIVVTTPVVTAPTNEELPTLALKKSTAEVIADTIRWAKWIAGDNSFHYGHGKAAHHNGCYFCGTNTLTGGRAKTGVLDYKKSYCCNPFVGAAWAHGGCDQTALGLCQKGTSWDYHKGKGYDASSRFKNLGHPKKSELKAGDVLCRDTHVALYIGDGKIVHAGHEDDNRRNSESWNSSIAVVTLTDANYKNFPRVHRYVGSVNATNVPLRHGEISARVKLWQKFLNKYNGKNVLAEDGIFGDSTLKYTKEFQSAKGLTADGIVGSGTLSKAR